MSDMKRTITPNDPADFAPTREPQIPLQPFRYWCQKVLPLVYDDSLSYYELLCKVVDYLNKTMEDVSNMDTDMDNLYKAYSQLQAYVNNYFDSLDVQKEIDNKLDEMANDGTLYEIIKKYTDPIVNEQNNKIKVLEARIDTITSLPSGSTAGDAELQDIRVGYNGTVYPNAGDAVRKQVSALNEDLDDVREDLADVRTEKETNLLKFINANWTTSNVIVSSDADSSIMHIKANNLTLASQQVFNVMLDNLIILEPNTTYTLTTSIVNVVSSQIRANNINLNRRDNYASVALIGAALSSVAPNKHSITFTTPSDETRFYFTFTFAKGAWDCDIDLNINLSKGSEPNYSQYEIVVDLNNNLPTIKKILEHKIYDIVVAKDGSGDYTNLTEAVEKAKDFSTIYVKNGVYDNEIIKAWSKTVFIVGESREGVIVKNNTGAYATPPIEMGTGMLKNLTVYAEGNATPSNKGYALHSESSVPASSCNFFILENCTFKSDYRQSWGMGMRGDTHYYARNCTFERVYFHDCEHAYRATDQYIEFDSCNIIAKANGTALLLQDQQMSGANVNLMFNRCLVKSENGENIQYGKWTGSGVEWVTSLDDFPNWHLSTYSFGNSDNDLNA